MRRDWHVTEQSKSETGDISGSFIEWVCLSFPIMNTDHGELDLLFPCNPNDAYYAAFYMLRGG